MKRRLLVCMLFILVVFLPALSMLGKSATHDEYRHFYTGLMYLNGQSLPPGVISSFTPPLEMIFALPTLFIKLDFTKNVYYFYDYLFLFRLVGVACSFLLGFYVYLWSKSIYGGVAAILALVFYALSPNIIANAQLIAVDVLLTFSSFIWFYYLSKAYDDYKPGNIFLCGLFFGLALISKFTVLMFILIYFILSLILILSRKKHERMLFWKRFLGITFWMAVIGWLILCAAYKFRFYSLETERALSYLPFLSALELPKNIILPFPGDYLKSLRFTLDVSAKGWPSFLMGDYSSKGWPHYYLVNFLIKTPIPVLILLFFSVFLRARAENRPPWRKEIFLWLPPLSIFLIASFQHCQIGLRHILPVYPFLFVFTSRIVGSGYSRFRICRYVFYALIAWLVFSSFRIFPHYMAYFNEFIGGPDNGYKYSLDANLDWGQDLYGLKRYMDERGIKKIKLAYFGTVPPEYYGIDYEEIPLDSAKGWIAISATHLQGLYLPDRKRYFWLKKYKPVKKIGYSLFIYEIKE